MTTCVPIRATLATHVLKAAPLSTESRSYTAFRAVRGKADPALAIQYMAALKKAASALTKHAVNMNGLRAGMRDNSCDYNDEVDNPFCSTTDDGTDRPGPYGDDGGGGGGGYDDDTGDIPRPLPDDIAEFARSLGCIVFPAAGSAPASASAPTTHGCRPR